MKKKLHIVHFISCLRYGGSEAVLIAIIKGMGTEEYTHTVLYIHGGQHTKTLDDLGVVRYQIKGLLTAHDPFLFIRLFKKLWQLKPDIIHTSLWVANFAGRIVGFLLRIPVVAAYHYDAMYDGKFRNKLDAYTGARWIPAVAASSSAAQSLVVKGIVPAKVQVIINGVRPFMVRDAANAAPHHERFLSAVRPEVVRQAHHESFHPEPVEGSKGFVIGMVARFHPVKNHATLFKALALLKQQQIPFRVLLIGDELPEYLAQQIATLDLAPHIHFVINQPASAYVASFDCFVLPSVSEGGISLALQEAMAAGVACVVSHEANTESIIKDGENGLLFSARDEQGLSQALIRIINDAQLRALLGNNATRTVQERCSYDRMIELYRTVFHKIAHK